VIIVISASTVQPLMSPRPKPAMAEAPHCCAVDVILSLPVTEQFSIVPLARYPAMPERKYGWSVVRSALTLRRLRFVTVPLTEENSAAN